MNQNAKPNILFIYDDQLRQDALSAYGCQNVHTPHCDQLIAEGQRFDQCFATVPVCTPARSMLLTGLHPSHSGMICNFLNMDPKLKSIAHLFGEADYDTAFIGKWHLSAGQLTGNGNRYHSREELNAMMTAANQYQTDHPSCEYTPPGPQRFGFKHWQAYNFHMDFFNGHFFEDSSERLNWDGYETDALADMTLDYIAKKQKDQQSFFAIYAPHPPHPPYKPDYAAPGYLEGISENLHWDDNVPSDHRFRDNPLAPRCYFSMVKNFDDNLGRILKFLDDNNLRDNTIVVLTADHGDQIGSRGMMGKMKPYRESVRVPLAIRWPGKIQAGSTSQNLFSALDFLPTLAALCGLPVSFSHDGFDHSPGLLGQNQDSPTSVMMANYTTHANYMTSYKDYLQPHWHPEWRAVKTLDHTYVEYLRGERELFDDQNDPYQMKNLMDQYDASHPLVKELSEQLQQHLKSAHDDFLMGSDYADWYDQDRNLIKELPKP